MSILINKDTRIVTQGITGNTGEFHTTQCLDYAFGKDCFVAGVTVSVSQCRDGHSGCG